MIIFVIAVKGASKQPAPAPAGAKKDVKKKPAAKAAGSKAPAKPVKSIRPVKKPKVKVAPLQKRKQLAARERQLAINKALKVQKKVINPVLNKSNSTRRSSCMMNFVVGISMTIPWLETIATNWQNFCFKSDYMYELGSVEFQTLICYFLQCRLSAVVKEIVRGQGRSATPFTSSAPGPTGPQEPPNSPASLFHQGIGNCFCWHL